MSDVVSAVGEAARQCPIQTISGWGIVSVADELIRVSHDQLSDPQLSSSLTEGWFVQIERLPLERLPYEVSSPGWDVSDALFTALLAMFLEGKPSFTLNELCRASNQWWPFFSAVQDDIRTRVRRLMIRIRKTALKDWIARVTPSGQSESEWRFKKRPPIRQATIAGFRRRHQRFVQIQMEKREPMPKDFDGVDAEQMVLPLIITE